MTWPAFVINMDANTGRLAAASAQLEAQGIAWSRISGIDGRKLTPGQIAQVYDAEANARRAKAPLVPAEIGCYLSHIEAWKQIAEGETEGGFVFEDDFQADTSLSADLAALSEPADWDMVKLFAFNPDAPFSRPHPLREGKTLVRPARVPTCLIGYGVTRDAARRLLTQVPPFFRPVDEDQKFVWETGLDVALVVPPPITVGDQQTVTGTIGQARRDAKERGLGSVLRRLRYRLDYLIRLSLHRMRTR